MQQTPVGEHAVVIGGSIAGLMAARVLSDYFQRVTLIERDALNDAPEARKGQPHFPGLVDDLQAGGAVVTDIGARVRWHIASDYRMQYPSGVRGLLMSRPFLEWHIRRRVLARSNVVVLDEHSVTEPLATPDRTRITGVRVARRAAAERHTEIRADLVVDAAGRGSHTPQWLDALGYGRPAEQTIKNGVSYATRVYRRRPGESPDVDVVIVSGEPPHGKRSALAAVIEGDRWLVGMNGVAGEQPPTNDADFVAWARNLAVPDVYDLISTLEPESPIAVHMVPKSIRRYYEAMARFPQGYLVLGDAVCSFNPLYAQGMTSAALQVAALDDVLRQYGIKPELTKRFFALVARIVAVPWQQGAGADFAYPETEGERPRGSKLLGAYMWRVQRATHRDPVVYGAFLKVMNLLAPPTTLFAPHIMLRVLAPRLLRSGRNVKSERRETTERQAPLITGD